MPDDSAATAAEAIAKAIKEGFRRARAGGQVDDDDEPERGHVPLSRLNRERKRWMDEVEALSAQVADLETAYDARLKEAVEAVRVEAATQVSTLQSAHVEDLALVDLGVTDPLGRQAVRMAWSQLPTTGRPKTAAEWFGGVREAHAAHAADPKAEPAPPDVPRPLQPYLGTPAAPAAPAVRGAPPAPGKAAPATGLPEGYKPGDGIEALFGLLGAQERQQG